MTFYKTLALMSEMTDVQPLSLYPLADAMQRCEYQGRAPARLLPHSIIVPFAVYHTKHQSTIFLCEEPPDVLLAELCCWQGAFGD